MRDRPVIVTSHLVIRQMLTDQFAWPSDVGSPLGSLHWQLWPTAPGLDNRHHPELV
jgi:hypothetical protein